MRALLASLRHIERWLLATLMILMAATFTLNVVIRSLVPAYASHVVWIEEACLFALAWVVFVGLGITLERGRHIAMSTLLERMAPPRQKAVRLAINLLGAAFSIYLVKLCIDITLFVLNSGQESPTLNISMGWLYAAMPVGFALLALRYVAELVGINDRYAVRAERGGVELHG